MKDIRLLIRNEDLLAAIISATKNNCGITTDHVYAAITIFDHDAIGIYDPHMLYIYVEVPGSPHHGNIPPHITRTTVEKAPSVIVGMMKDLQSD